MKSNGKPGLFLVPRPAPQAEVAFAVPLPESRDWPRTTDEQNEQIAKLAADFASEYHPRGTTETAMIQNMAAARWRATHGTQLQARAEQTLDWDRLTMLERYRVANERSFRMALKTLRVLQKARPRPVLVNGTKPIKPKTIAEC